MSTTNRKYVPPHKRRDSATKPPPAFAMDTYREHSNQQRPYDRRSNRSRPRPFYSANNASFSNPRFSRHRHRHSLVNHVNHTTLQETDVAQMQVETVRLDEYVVRQSGQKRSIILIVSEHTDHDTAKLIYDFCSDDTILIRNTFDRAEFLSHWFVATKGEHVNLFRDLHRVDLHPNRLQLTRRGAVVSCKEYKPSKSAKLRFEIRFKLHDDRDTMTLSLRSSGTRDPNIVHAKYGELDVGSNALSMWRNHITTTGKDVDGLVIRNYTDITPSDLDTEISVVMIDDGETVTAQYVNGDSRYTLQYDSSAASEAYRVCVWNRETKYAVADVTFLQLSVVTDNE